jgi:hypothetical protein
MITRLYANNFRCLVAFEMHFDSFGVLCGPNGAGKSSVFDAIRLIRNLATGEGILGGEREHDVPELEFTNWLDSKVQEFEIGVTVGGKTFDYLLHLEQTADYEKPRIVRERAICNGRNLFERDLKGVSFKKQDGSVTGFPLDWRQTALASIQPAGVLSEVEGLQEAMSRLLILRPNPRGMEKESRAKAKQPDLYLGNLVSWYRTLAGDTDYTDSLRKSLSDVWPDFGSLKLVDVGLNAEALRLRFGSGSGGDILFHKLSDGEKGLVGLYMVRAALHLGAAETVLIDEPDNYVGLPELQPWVLSLRELLDDTHQGILISHHPEVLDSSGAGFGRYLWRDNHTSPTRMAPLDIPAGLSPGEAIARGWVTV